MTVKLKLQATPAQFQLFRATQLSYRDALNHVIRYAFAHGKMSNAVRLQEGTYQEIRTRFHLPSQMACSVPRQVGATYKTLWTKMRQNAHTRQAGWTRKHYKEWDQPPTFVSPTLTYQYGKDYSFKKEQQVSILSLAGRVVLAYSGYDQHVALILKGAEATNPPHPQALPAHPTLEEAYLLFQEEMGQAERAEPFISPKPV
ncbi:hypothetical protein KSB_63480 [Ktedonobacter robiniae]|uniref:Transposase n=1 Tax=Ktedonobacter robiniae TaxID=2778365 RepID=A0ABQ3UYY0_9CHLR|nr:hypothetical protein KSB_63480 [Ktedonobacter robiniae]